MKKILLAAIFGVIAFFSQAQSFVNEKYADTVVSHDESLVKLIYFFGTMNDNRLLLKWNVADNQSANLFQVEKSYDGSNFVTGALIFSSERPGNETYFFPEVLEEQGKIFYRLKIIGKNQKVKYSKTLSFRPVLIPEKNSFAAYSNNSSTLNETL